MKKSKIFLLIAGFLTLTVGSFIWFIATWDAEKEQPIGFNGPPENKFVNILPRIHPSEAPAFQERATL